MTISFVMNSSTLEEELVDIYRIILDSAALNISAIVYQHNSGAINIYDTKADIIYVVHFTSMFYTLQEPIEVPGDTITELTLVCYAKYNITAQENPRLYRDPEVG